MYCRLLSEKADEMSASFYRSRPLPTPNKALELETMNQFLPSASPSSPHIMRPKSSHANLFESMSHHNKSVNSSISFSKLTNSDSNYGKKSFRQYADNNHDNLESSVRGSMYGGMIGETPYVGAASSSTLEESHSTNPNGRYQRGGKL